MEKKVNVPEVNSAFWNDLFPAGCIVASLYPVFSIISANDEMVRMMEYKDADEMNKAASGSMLNFIHPDDMERVLAEGSHRSGCFDIYEIDYRIMCKSGRYCWVRQRSRHIIDDDGRELIVATYMDITEKREAANLFDGLTDNLPGGVFLYLDNETGEFKYVNSNFYRLLGYTPDEFRVKFHNSFNELIYEEDRERVLKEIRKQLKVSDYDKCKYRIEKKDGSLMWVSDAGHLAIDADGNPCFYVVVIDITDNQLLSNALEEARLANSAKNQFLSRMSHDVRTPMNAIIGLTSLAMDEPDVSPAVQDDLEKIANSSQYLLGLINDILDVSRIESGKMELHPVRYSFAEFKQTVFTIVETLTKMKEIEFVFETGQTELAIMVDKLRFNQIFINLISNAIKFTPQGGKVEFLVKNNRVENGILRCDFVVRDNGIGMSEEFMKVMYEPFTQADTTSNINNSSGLGLTIVRSLVDLMGGNIRFESAPGKGTTVLFNLSMPVAPDQEPVKTDKPCIRSDCPLKGKMVMVAEDNPLNMEIIRRLLEKREITVIQEAVNGQEAVDAFRVSPEGSISAILMDIRMPVMNGLEAASAIRKMARKDATEVPIIALTANAYDEDRQKSLNAGMNEHLTKPLDPALLYSVLEKFICRQTE